MSAQHTPGPWVVSKRFRTPVVGYDVGDGGDPLPIVDVVHGYDTKQARANAHLIAAAPRLLAALERLVTDLSEQDEEGLVEHAPQMEEARSAIAAAKGAV